MSRADLQPSREAFLKESRESTVVPVVRELIADWWTPVAAFQRLAARSAHAFLLESVEQGERVGRYSFLGRRPFLTVRARGSKVRAEGEDASRHATGGPPLEVLERILAAYRSRHREDLPPFISGAVGVFGFDTVRWVETLPVRHAQRAIEDDLTLLFLEDVVAFDHVRRRLFLVANARVHAGDNAGAAYDRAVERLALMERDLFAPFSPPAEGADALPALPDPVPNQDPETFQSAVRQAKEHINAGDIFQVVLSQRFTVPGRFEDLALYRALRAVNPSPYMFLLRWEGASAVGSSPEPLVRVQGRRLEYRPIAGTAPRSGDPAEDARRAEAMLGDPKERAEHVMLVDLGRNDLGRVAEPGSVSVDELMRVERYSHVMHLVSGLSGTLRAGLSPLDALYACFPAGTVSGAPKIRAMELIEELEPDARGLYAGAVGYLDFSGNLDTCIALRTMIVRPNEVCIQAGAGIVADSDPLREYEETRHKARALIEAVRLARRLGSHG